MVRQRREYRAASFPASRAGDSAAYVRLFDLDPGEGADIRACIEVAFLLKDVLSRLGLESLPKVSGSKGIQVYAPLNSGVTYSATQPFAHALAQFLASRHPKLIVAEMAKIERKKKVFIDFCESHKQKPEMVAGMDRLLNHYNYADVARILNERNFKTGDGLPLTSVAIGYVRKAHGLKSRFDRLRERGLLTIREVAQACGVSTKTISEWRQKGLLRGHAINDRNQFLFENPGPTPPKEHRRTISRSAA